MKTWKRVAFVILVLFIILGMGASGCPSCKYYLSCAKYKNGVVVDDYTETGDGCSCPSKCPYGYLFVSCYVDREYTEE